MPSDNSPAPFWRFSTTRGWETTAPLVIAETTVSLMVNGEPWLSFTCTPADLEALAAGFLFNEGIIERRNEIAVLEICGLGACVDVWLHKTVERPQTWLRTSGCTGGVTSTAHAPARQAPHGPRLAPEALLQAMEQLLKAQDLYRDMGGIHCSAVSDGREILVNAEDIGRHNTLDKLAGRMLLEDLHISPMIILTTGRISSEMLQKSARMGAVIIASRTSPTSQSVKLAEELGIALVGYARRNGFLAYCHPERLGGEPAG